MPEPAPWHTPPSRALIPKAAPIIEEPDSKDSELENPDAEPVEEVDCKEEPPTGSPADAHIVPLDYLDDVKYLEEGDPRREAIELWNETGGKRWR